MVPTFLRLGRAQRTLLDNFSLLEPLTSLLFVAEYPAFQMLEYLTPVASRFSSTTAILVLLLMLIHVARRCYETQSICVYSDSKMNIGHYAMGMIHYAILPLTVVCEAEVYRSGVFDWTGRLFLVFY